MPEPSQQLLRDQLQEERERVREQLNNLGRGDAADLDFDENFADSGQVADERGDAPDTACDESFAASGQVTAERGEVDALSGQLTETLQDIEDALAKFDAGTYGSSRFLEDAVSACCALA